jgi:hypothetical protein
VCNHCQFTAADHLFLDATRCPCLTPFSSPESVTPAALDKLFSDYILLGLADMIVCGGGSFCTMAALHANRPMLTYPSRPPSMLPLCLQNAHIIGPARHVSADGSRCAE